MAHYSVATSKDHLSRLIDKAIAGEEVVITRHGRPMVELRVIEQPAPRVSQDEWMERLKALRETIPSGTSYLDLKRAEEEERRF